MVLANQYFEGIGSIQTFIFSSITVSHSLHCSQESHQSLKSSNRPGNRFPLGNYHHIRFIRVIISDILVMVIQKICHKGLLHLQIIVIATVLSEP